MVPVNLRAGRRRSAPKIGENLTDSDKLACVRKFQIVEMAGHRSRYSDDQLGGAIYTELERQTKPCSVPELCKTQPGLQPHEERVKDILDNMCSSEMVVRVGENYILKEKWTASLARRSLDSPDNSIDGPPERASAGPVTVYERPPPPSASRAVVPVQQMSVTSSCDPNQCRLNTEIFTKIMTAFDGRQEPIKANKVAQLAGLGNSRSDVNRYLYCLQSHGILSKNNQAQWSLVRNPTGDDLVVFGAELAKKPPGKPKSSAAQQSASLGTPPCSCPNAGPGCVHMTNIQQINNHYNIQVGDNSQMHVHLPQDPRRYDNQ